MFECSRCYYFTMQGNYDKTLEFRLLIIEKVFNNKRTCELVNTGTFELVLLKIHAHSGNTKLISLPEQSIHTSAL